MFKRSTRDVSVKDGGSGNIWERIDVVVVRKSTMNNEAPNSNQKERN
jgi:hypothetical protein